MLQWQFLKNILNQWPYFLFHDYLKNKITILSVVSEYGKLVVDSLFNQKKKGYSRQTEMLFFMALLKVALSCLVHIWTSHSLLKSIPLYTSKWKVFWMFPSIQTLSTCASWQKAGLKLIKWSLWISLLLVSKWFSNDKCSND
jgi:hypothetical protein